MVTYICFDIGGTAIKYGLADPQGNFLDQGETPTEVRETGTAGMLKKIMALIEDYQTKGKSVGIAISTAGVVDPVQGKILYAADHFPGYTGTCLKDLIETRFALPCRVENDVNAAALGEYWRGAGQGAASLFCLTIGTGIGGCTVLDGRVVPGITYSAGEIGYLRAGGGSCTLEEAASVRRLIADVAAAKGIPENKLDGKTIFSLAQTGDPVAIEAIDHMVTHLARGLAVVCYILNPERIIVGGGITAQQDYLRPRLEAALKKELLPFIYEQVQLEFAHLGNRAGMTGALYNFLQRKKDMKK